MGAEVILFSGGWVGGGMETWRLLAGASVMLIVWAGITVAMGRRPGAVEIVVALVLAMIGFYVGDVVTTRYLE